MIGRIAVLVALASATASASESETPDVVVMTFGVGPKIFEKYGHAAICLRYHEAKREPECFNYGVTNFEAVDALVWGFMRGNQKFWVEPEGWYATLGFYEAEDRDIWQQVLPLSPDQARAIETKLRYDVEGDHRYYDYDHFADNCTTRVRDLVDAATGGKLRAGGDAPFPLTFREVGVRGLASAPSLVALTDFVIGRSLDRAPTVWEAMFLPDVLREQLAVKLGATPELLNKREGPAFPTSGSSGRLSVLAGSFVFALPLLLATWRRRWQTAATAWATLYLAGWGIVIWTAVVVSAIPALRWNEVALVFVPFDLVLPLLALPRRRAYARGRVVMLLMLSVLRGIGVLRQPLWIPILTAIVPHAIIAFGRERAPGVGVSDSGGGARTPTPETSRAAGDSRAPTGSPRTTPPHSET